MLATGARQQKEEHRTKTLCFCLRTGCSFQHKVDPLPPRTHKPGYYPYTAGYYPHTAGYYPRTAGYYPYTPYTPNPLFRHTDCIEVSCPRCGALKCHAPTVGH